MYESDRRRAPRFQIQIPLKVRPLTPPDAPVQVAESSNISLNGVFFLMNPPLSVGTPVQLFVCMPEEVAGSSASEWCCQGRVVRSSAADPPGVGVEIHFYEVSKLRDRVLNQPLVRPPQSLVAPTDPRR